MARGQKAKQKELTPEERLQNALVPKEEWPYELPEGWKWVTLGKLTDVIGGGTPSTRHPEYYEGGIIPWLSPADLSGYSDMYISKGQKNITQEGLDNSSSKLLPKGTVCLSSRAPIGYVAITQNPLCTNQGFKSFVPSKYIYPEFLYWYLKANKSMLESMASGTTFLELSGKKAGQIVIPLPPIEIQKTISLFVNCEFARLDEAKDKIQSVIDSSEERKQSILHKAVTGELSAKWRKDNGYSLNKWSRSSINDVCKDVKVGIVIKPTRYYTGSHGIPAFRSANVREFYVQDSDWVYISEQGQKDNQRTVVHTNDVLIVRSGNPGTACVVPEKFDGCNAIDIIIAVPNQDMIYPEYLCIFTNSPIGRRKIQSGVRGMALTHFNVTSFGKLKINVPSLEEQHEIVRMVKRYLENDKKVRDAASEALDQLEETRKTILSKAFRGELIR